MADLTYTELVEAVRATVAAATGLKEAQAGETLTESIQNYPMAQVYLEAETTDVSGNTDRTTFGGGVRQSEITLNIDVYTTQRAHVGQDQAAVLTYAEAVRATLIQNQKPYFGVGIKSFRWTMERVTFEYADVKYAGLRFVLVCRIF